MSKYFNEQIIFRGRGSSENAAAEDWYLSLPGESDDTVIRTEIYDSLLESYYTQGGLERAQTTIRYTMLRKYGKHREFDTDIIFLTSSYQSQSRDSNTRKKLYLGMIEDLTNSLIIFFKIPNFAYKFDSNEIVESRSYGKEFQFAEAKYWGDSEDFVVISHPILSKPLILPTTIPNISEPQGDLLEDGLLDLPVLPNIDSSRLN